MVGFGAILAAVGRPESSLIWGGTVLVGLGLLGSRVKSFKFGPSGADIELRDVEQALVKGKQNATSVELPPQTAPTLEGPIFGSYYYTQPAMDAVVRAFGSNTPYERSQAPSEFNTLAAAGTAVVQVVPSGSGGGSPASIDLSQRPGQPDEGENV